MMEAAAALFAFLGGGFLLSPFHRRFMDTNTKESLDESMRLVVIGDAVLCEAENNPAFMKWLARFLDARLTEAGDRELFDFLLPPDENDTVIPFPATLVPPEPA
jgi:hypothetical protein